jgi:cobalt-zinc-cadmium efflux system outer membrane protein
MNGRRIVFTSFLLAGGCSTVDPQPAIDLVHSDVAERAEVSVDWEAEKSGNEAIEKVVSAKLSGEMTVDDTVAVSLLKNPKLRALYRGLGVAQSDLVAAGLPENPVFSAERRFRGKAAEFDVAQEFMSVFLIPLRSRIAESEFERERLRITHEVLHHTAEVRTGYFQVQAAEQMVEMRRSVARAMDASLEAARSLRKAGNTSTLEVAQEERGANRARLELADAELEAAMNRERVNVLLGLWGEETKWHIPPRLPEVPEDDISSEELEKRAITDRLDLASLRAEIESLAQSLGLTNITSVLPSLTIGGHSEREPEGDNTAGPSLSFPISIFNRGQSARARAKYLLLEAEDRYAALAVEIRSEVRMAFARMTLAKNKAQFYKREVLPVQQVVSDQTQLQYNGMFLGVFQLLQAKQAQIDAGRDYIQALSEYWLARTELEKALEWRLPTGALRPSALGEPKAEPIKHQHN